MHCCNINKSRRGNFFSVHLVDYNYKVAIWRPKIEKNYGEGTLQD